MSEIPQQQGPEFEQESGLWRIVDQYMPEDREFLEDMDMFDRLGYVYGTLLSMDEDPDVILAEFGVTERGGDEV